MKDDIFTVHFIPKSNCFLYFPEHSIQCLLKTANSSKCCLHMKYGENKSAYFSWSPQHLNNKDDHSVGISAAYAHKLGLKDNEEVLLSCLNLNTSVSKMKVCVVSPDDWDVMEMSLHSIQSSLLNQIRVVWPGQIFVVWVSKYLHFSLRVDSIDPSSLVGVLETFTDLIVSLPDSEAEAKGISNDPVSQASTTSATGELHDSPEVNSGHVDESTLATALGATSDEANALEVRASTFWDTILKTLFSAFSSKHKQDVLLEKSNAFSSNLRVNNSVTPYRVHPLRIHQSTIDKSNTADSILCQPFNVFVHKCNLQPEIVNLFRDQDVVVCRLSKMPRSSDTAGEEQEGNAKVNAEENPTVSREIATSREVYASLHIVEDVYSGLSSRAKKWFFPTAIHSEHCCILVPDTVQKALKISTGDRLLLTIEQQETPKSSESTNIDIVTSQIVTHNSEELKTLFYSYLKRSSGKSSLLLNTQVALRVELLDTLAVDVFIRLSPPELKYVLLDSAAVNKCNIEVKVNSENSSFKILDTKENLATAVYFGESINHLVNEGSAMLELGLGLQLSTCLVPCFTSNILIVGNPGSGRSMLARHLCNRVKQAPHFVHCVEVQCSHLKGKTVEALQKLLNQWVADCIVHQPAVLFLDDVDSIVGVSMQLEEHSAEAAYTFRIGEMVAETLNQVQRRNYVLVIATAPSISKLSPSVAAARGQHFFKTVLQIPDLAKQDRLELLKALITQKTGQIATDDTVLQLESHASKAEGYVVQDIADMVDKAVFAAWKRSLESKQDVMLEDCDVQAAMENTVPLSLRGVTLYKDAAQSWADVGGLMDVKRVLVEALQWPSQYTELFSRCPLRHQSGLLLYGAPGTGKTLLAGAVAHECGLNFISVKGPELLSKYIGASEEAVRSIFQKAQSAQPCVLFFDEFDSLAPRRGHDSTGVTDRVVNQLLTQLDGVESLVGVWVVAATSRPDLLDPALLRPGRLDRAVQCSLPEPVERLDILKAQSRRMRLAPDVDLAVIADGTHGFTGADLQAVLYTAQLAAVEDACRSAAAEMPTALGEVTQQHLMAALDDTRPSLSPDEKMRYQRIYEKFVGSRSGKSREMEVVSQRITLA